MKNNHKYISLAALTILTLVLFVSFGTSDSFGVDFGGHQINFVGATYDAGMNATTFTYHVIAAATAGFDSWILELNPDCFGAGDIIGASESYMYVGPDPATGVYGIKFDQPYAAGESRSVWFMLLGNLSSTTVKIFLVMGCSYWEKEIPGPECIGKPKPPVGEGMSPGYWGNQLAIYLGYKAGKLKEPNVASYAGQYGYTAEEAYSILNYGGDIAVEKLHRQLLAAKLSTAAGYLSDADELLEWGQYMVAHPWEFTEQEILDAKNLFESLHD